jgi:hypothetical protein
MFFSMWGSKIKLFKHWPLELNKQVHKTYVKAFGLKELQTSQLSIFTLQNHGIFSFIATLLLFVAVLPSLYLLQKLWIISISRLDPS